MPLVLTDGKIKIGAYMWRDRKKPTLCVEKGNEIVIYGTFNNISSAEKFMSELGKLVNADQKDANL